MNFFKVSFSICLQNLRKWSKDYRIWSIFALLFIVIQIYVDDIKKLSLYLDCDIPVWIFPFMYSQYYTKVLFTVPIILLFCNAPFIDQNQLYIYIRSGRKKWLTGQILYIIAASFIYYLFILVISILSTSIYGGFSMEWGKCLFTLAETNIAIAHNCPFVDISSLIVDYFTPLQAVGFTFLVSWLNAVLIGMTIFTCNYLTNIKYLGISISAFMIVFSWFVLNTGLPVLVHYSPTSWITLDNIDIGGKTTNPGFSYCITFYLICIILLISLSFLLSRKKGIDVRS